MRTLLRTSCRARSLPRAQISPRTRFRAHKFPRARAPGGLPAAAATMKSIPGSPPKGENFFHNYEINMKSIPALTEDAPAAPNGPPNAPPKGRRNSVFCAAASIACPLSHPATKTCKSRDERGNLRTRKIARAATCAQQGAHHENTGEHPLARTLIARAVGSAH